MLIDGWLTLIDEQTDANVSKFSKFSTRTFQSGQTLRRGKNWFVPPHDLHITLPSLRAVSPPAG